MAEHHSSPSATAEYAELLSLAVHEFRTPASVVGGYLRMLQREDPPPAPRQKTMIDAAEKSCARLVALIAELSELAKLDAGTALVQEDRFDLFQTISEVAATVPEVGDREVLLQVRGEATGAPMRGDLIRIRAAFGAFFRSVLREQPASGTVVVDRHRQGSSAITVIAEASGVQAAYDAAPRPFEEKRGGLGLLLPIGRRVIERHGGRIWSPSAPGPATALIVSLPLSEIPLLSPEPGR